MDATRDLESDLFPLPVFENLRRGLSVTIQDLSPSVTPPVSHSSPVTPPQAPVGTRPPFPRATLPVRPTFAPRPPPPAIGPEPIVIAPVSEEVSIARPRILLLNGFAVPTLREGPRGELEVTLFVTYHYLVPGYGVISFHLRDSRSIRVVPTFISRQQ